MSALQEGLYAVSYVSQSGNGRWYRYSMVAAYLGEGPGVGETQWSLRPRAGTMTLTNHDRHPARRADRADSRVARPG